MSYTFTGPKKLGLGLYRIAYYCDPVDPVATKLSTSSPAFPTPPGIQHNDGMTLRDYFAAAALQGMLANPNIYDICDEAAVLESFEIADAMLKARESK
jgi:hypothetical protein